MYWKSNHWYFFIINCNAKNNFKTVIFKVYIHAYDESPGFDYRPQFQWNINDEVDILISMKQTYTTNDARQLTIGQRKCIFPNEKKLKYYNDDYTFSGCMRQCRIQKCINFCKCVPPFYQISCNFLFITYLKVK